MYLHTNLLSVVDVQQRPLSAQPVFAPRLRDCSHGFLSAPPPPPPSSLVHWPFPCRHTRGPGAGIVCRPVPTITPQRHKFRPPPLPHHLPPLPPPLPSYPGGQGQTGSSPPPHPPHSHPRHYICTSCVRFEHLL